MDAAQESFKTRTGPDGLDLNRKPELNEAVSYIRSHLPDFNSCSRSEMANMANDIANAYDARGKDPELCEIALSQIRSRKYAVKDNDKAVAEWTAWNELESLATKAFNKPWQPHVVSEAERATQRMASALLSKACSSTPATIMSVHNTADADEHTEARNH